MKAPTLIRTGNITFLIVVFLVVPWLASRRFGSYQIVSHQHWQQLTLGGLAAGAGLNFLFGSLFVRQRRTRRACRIWALIHCGLLILEWLIFGLHLQ